MIVPFYKSKVRELYTYGFLFFAKWRHRRRRFVDDGGRQDNLLSRTAAIVKKMLDEKIEKSK